MSDIFERTRGELTKVFGRFSRNSSPVQYVHDGNGVMKDPEWRRHMKGGAKTNYDIGTLAKLLGVSMSATGLLLTGFVLYKAGAVFQGLARTSTETKELLDKNFRRKLGDVTKQSLLLL